MIAATRTPSGKLLLMLLAIIVAVGGSSCAKHAPTAQSNSSSNSEPSSSKFDYYLLALSWVPQFCATASGDASECDPQHHFGFVVHSLWPQNEGGTYPMNCAQVRPAGQETVRHMMTIMPSRGLIQHEWREHGSCAGSDPGSYFAEVEKAFTQLNIPADYRRSGDSVQRNPRDVEQSFADTNRGPVAGRYY